MTPKKIKLKRPLSVVLNYGDTEIMLAGNSSFCSIVEGAIMLVKDEEMYADLKSKDLIEKELN